MGGTQPKEYFEEEKECICGYDIKTGYRRDIVCPVHDATSRHSEAQLDAMIETVKTGVAVKPKEKVGLPKRLLPYKIHLPGENDIIYAINQLIDYLRSKEERK